MNTNTEEKDVTYNSAYNPFPEPQTIPSGWDLSGIISTPQLDSEELAQDSPEIQSN